MTKKKTTRKSSKKDAIEIVLDGDVYLNVTENGKTERIDIPQQLVEGMLRDFSTDLFYFADESSVLRSAKTSSSVAVKGVKTK